MLKDFKAFIFKKNVVDLAVAVIIGAAFGRIITSLVNDILMPIIGLLIGNVNISKMKWVLVAAQGDSAEVAILIGSFLQHLIDFVMIGFFIFIVLRLIQSFSKKQEEEAVALTISEDVILLREIRDLLKVK